MKKQLHSFGIIFLSIAITNAFAQNPKTNAGNLNNKSPQGYQATEIPTKPSQNPVKKDSVYNQNSDSTDQVQNNTSKNLNSNKGLCSAGIILGISQNQYKQVSNGDIGIGFGITAMGNLMATDNKEKDPVNIFIGGTFEYLYFGGKSNTNSYDYTDFFYPAYNFNNSVTTSVNLNVYTLMISSRIEFFNGPIILFFEAAAGARLFDGKEKITATQTQTLKPGWSGQTYPPNKQDFSDNLQSDLTWCYGYGGGLRIGKPSFYIELKLMNYKGTTATYVDNESIKIDPATNKVSYNTKTSTTDMLIPQISISGTF